MKKTLLFGLVVMMVCGTFAFSALAVTSCSSSGQTRTSPRTVGTGSSSEPAKVFMTTDISPEGIMAIYRALGVEPNGRVGVKIHTGESPNSNHLRPEMIKDLVHHVNGTIVETNTAYGGNRASTALHRQLAMDHGFTAIAEVDIQDENGSIRIPVRGGTRLQENLVGSSFKNYDYYVVLSHFKGHGMAGFGGAIKNIAIGFASAEGKALIHTGGSHNSLMNLNLWGLDQDTFLDSMAEAGKSVVDSMNGNLLYINVMNRMSTACDCHPSPPEPDMRDIGILGSLDPVALDQACVDLVYAAPDGRSLIDRMESLNGIRALEHSAAIGVGSRAYEIIMLN